MSSSTWGILIGSFAVGAAPVFAAEGMALKAVSAFSGIEEPHARSMTLFVEAAKVIQSPRCLNCHPVTRKPTQDIDLHGHVPPMNAGAGDHGVPGLPCKSCHGDANAATLASSIASIPGHPRWGLAPVSMAWQGKSLREICLQLKDRASNGGRSLSEIHEHVARDSLVGWAWHLGGGVSRRQVRRRSPAPSSQPGPPLAQLALNRDQLRAQRLSSNAAFCLLVSYHAFHTDASREP